MNRKAVVIIPARLESTRLKQKLLLAETGKPLIQHTYENALKASVPSEVIIAADSREILDAVEPYGSKAVLTSKDHASGTDRIAEAARNIDADIVVNVQGDEPEIPPEVVDSVASALIDDPSCPMATAAAPLEEKRITDPSCVKVVRDRNGYALYFSRAPIPFKRDADSEYGQGPFLHLGIYSYTREFLFNYTSLKPSSLELTEKLEQLRVIENGYRIKVLAIERSVPGIDTADDYKEFVTRYNNSLTP
jgi:3-deoxy-manno-octulosonate cytidylyltransferase (CMP-KDO synthetase)